jgi:hypothetical protein
MRTKASERIRINAWRRANPDRTRMARRRERRALKLMEKRLQCICPMALVPWANQGIIGQIYDRAFDHGMEVDHIIPIRGLDVCGLHWEGNLQVIERLHNRQKGHHTYNTDNNVDILIFPTKRRLPHDHEQSSDELPGLQF